MNLQTPAPTHSTAPIPFPRTTVPAQEPHWNAEAETAVLGSLLLDREAILAIAGWFQPSWFYLAKHQTIYQAALSVFQTGTPPDIKVVSEQLRQKGQLEPIGGILYLSSLSDNLPTASHILSYARIVARAALLREAGRQLGSLTASAMQPGADPAALMQQIENVNRLLQQQLRALEPGVIGRNIEDLWAKEFPPLTWIIPELLPEGLTLCAGKAKSGKSLLAINIAGAVASGGMALGNIRVTQGDVLYLCLDDPERTLQTRMEESLKGRPSLPLMYDLTWPALDAGGLSRLDLWCQDHPDARLVVIDTLAHLQTIGDGRQSQLYLKDYSFTAALRDLAHRYKLSILANTHTRKADATDAMDSVMGTSGTTGGATNVWVFKRVRGEDSAELQCMLREAPSTERALSWDSQLSGWSNAGDAKVFRLTELRAEILSALDGETFYPRELYDLVDAPSATIRKQLAELKRQNLVKVDREKYSLTPDGIAKIKPDSNLKIQQKSRISGSGGSTGSGGSADQGYRPIWEDEEEA